MNGWHTIKNVRKELSEALKSAKGGDPTTSLACMENAINLLVKHLKEAQAPEYGFEAETLGS